MQNLNENLIFSDEGKFGKLVTNSAVSDAQTGLRAELGVAEQRPGQQPPDLGETARVCRGEPWGECRPAVHH